MTKKQNFIPKWILILSGFLSIMEILVSISLFYDPKSVVETLDLTANGVEFVVYMWAVRQFALGFIFGFATFKKSKPMLMITYIFFLVMFMGDCFIGFLHKENSLVISALIMCLISATVIFVLSKRK